MDAVNLDHRMRMTFLSLSLGLILYEFLWSLVKKKKLYDPRETLTNIGIIGGYLIFQTTFLTWTYSFLTLVQSQSPIHFHASLAFFPIAILATDFTYYWEHRAMHRVKPLWAIHLAHHSGEWLNYSAAYRLNWLAPLVSAAFLAPLALLGIPIPYLLFGVTIGLMYQFWCHTRSIGKVGWIEGILNTPSAHRVHHASNPAYLDKNFGAILMIWDRLFGTYVPESESPRFGITTGYMGYNPFKLMFRGFFDWARGEMAYRG